MKGSFKLSYIDNTRVLQKCQYQDNERILIALEKALMAATKVNVTSGCLWLVLVSVGKVELGIVST